MRSQEGVEFKLTGIKQLESKSTGGDFQPWRFICVVERIQDGSQARVGCKFPSAQDGN